MILSEVLQKAKEFFKKKNIENARLEAELLLAYALEIRRIDLYLQFEKALNEAELVRCREVVKRRADGEPVAYITGQKEFFGINLKVGPGVLIPRPETEMIVELALEAAKEKAKPLTVIDLGSGSGCIPIAIATHTPECQIVAIEKSVQAIPYLTKNSELFSQIKIQNKNVVGVELELQEWADIVTANPPYIAQEDLDIHEAVKKYEPHEALFSSKQGLQDIEDWSTVAYKCLKPGGHAYFEIGHTQGESAKKIFEAQNFCEVKVIKDLAGLDRVVSARKQP